MLNGPHILTVHQLNSYLKAMLEHERSLQGILVRGEVSNCKYPASGHLYFTLKDAQSQLPCVMWRDRVRATPVRVDNGMRLIVEGNITVYPTGGYYQLSAYDVQADGVGNLYLAFEQLKRKLEAEGLFDAERKRPLPALPRKVALITSPSGAVIHDFVTIATRRWRSRRIVIVPSSVQGTLATTELRNGLALAAQVPEIDVIVLARGGGSFEDLACFNDEALARAIAEAPVPVVSAVGHDTDYTIADFVADLRAPTPSAAAELIFPDLHGVAGYLNACMVRIHTRMRGRLERDARDLARLSAHPALRNPMALIRAREQALDLVTERIRERGHARLTATGARLATLDARIAALDPRGVLLRGYAMVTRPDDGALISSRESALVEPSLDLQFADGTLRVRPITQ